MQYSLSVITWCNDEEKWGGLVETLHSFYGHQKGRPEVEFIKIGPERGCRSMGEAYNLGQREASCRIKAYLHQDVRILDHNFVARMEILLRNPRIGAVGFVGSTVDTGGGWFHAANSSCFGVLPSARYSFGEPETMRVAVVDGLGLVTGVDLRWNEAYVGPHLAVEDMCLCVREAGREVWIADSPLAHLSEGSCDAGYWRSLELFQRLWPEHVPANCSVNDLKADFERRYGPIKA